MNNATAKKRAAFVAIPLAVSLAFLLFAGVGTVQASIDDREWETYEANIELTQLEVGLSENGEPRENGGKLLENLVPQGQPVAFGKYYDENLAAVNTGSQPEYMRVTVSKFWLDA